MKYTHTKETCSLLIDLKKINKVMQNKFDNYLSLYAA